jgi:hypothetical protein
VTSKPLTLVILPMRLAVCQLAPAAPVPALLEAAGLLASIRTADELTVVCAEEFAPPGARVEPGWRALKVRGPLDLSLVGILAALANPLTQAGVSIFALSTFDTDYVLVKEERLAVARQVLSEAGCVIEG